ncbi:MAG TPA: glycerate kinase, partial [Solibacterales bacterium]|nr:glycerate kinase [Bryobacterales bacterium]
MPAMERQLRRDASNIFAAALRAADPVEAVLRCLSADGGILRAGKWTYDLSRIGRVFVLGAGKASARMAVAVERVLGKRIAGGLINVKDGHTAKLRRIELNECGHPVPDERGVEGARRIAGIAQAAGPGDLVLCLISGGGSALLPLPAPPITLPEKQAATRLLLECGATIHEINCVRKHVSAIKGGQLAALAAPASVLALMLSDVIGDDLDVIGSGPTAPDSSTFDRALSIFDRYGIRNRVPASIRERLEQGAAGMIPETPKPGASVFRNVRNLVVGSNALAVDAAARRAGELGYRTLVLSTFLEGETRDLGAAHAAIAKEIAASGRPLKPPCCVISGGETTVTIRGEGLGGRNQEFALAAAPGIAGLDRVLILSAGTDGTDGPTDAAGALVTGSTMRRAGAAGLDFAGTLANNDSYRFLDALGDLVRTGPTGTNV